MDFLTTNQNAIHSYFSDGSFNVNLTATNQNGCSDTADTLVTIFPQPDISTGSDTAICYGDSVMLSASGAASYAWLPDDFLNSSTIANPVAKPESDIQYNVIGISANGCLNYSTISITVNMLPDVQVPPDTIICPNSSIILFALGGTERHWTPSNNLSDTTSEFVWASPGFSTTYHVTVFNQSGCSITDSVMVDVFPKTEMRVGPPGEICKGDKFDLVASGAQLYQWTPPDGLNCDRCESPVASPEVSTHYAVAAIDAYGCQYNDSVRVFVREIPKLQVMQDATICKGETVMLFADTFAAESIRWHPPDFLNDADLLNPSASPDDSITYIASASNNLGCKSEDTVRVNVLKKVDAGLLGSDICKGESVQLEAFVNRASQNGYQIQWLPENLFDNSISAIQTVSPSQSTEISVIVSSQTCEADTAAFNLRVHDLPEVNAGFDRIVYLGESITLNAYSYSQINSYHWSPMEELDCSSCPSPMWTADGSQIFTVQVLDENGCPATDSVAFRVIGGCMDGVYVPTAFTPNGDEVNDRLFARSLNPIKLYYFKIFDRWGKQVYSSDDSEEGWDGTFEGRNVVDGVYVYHLKAGCSNGQAAFLKGNVTIIR